MTDKFLNDDQTRSLSPRGKPHPHFVEAGETQATPAFMDPSRRSPRLVELVYFDGCPNWKTADHHLQALKREFGFQLEHRMVTNDEDAQAAGFHGSPTILLDGHDPFATSGEPFGLSCRVYETPDGIAGSPTVEQLRRVLHG